MDGQSAETLAKIEAQISKKTNGSLIYLVLGGLGAGFFIFCPLAYFRSKQALRLIEEYGVGQQYRGNAKVIAFLAALVFVGYAIGVVIFLVLMLTLS